MGTGEVLFCGARKDAYARIGMLKIVRGQNNSAIKGEYLDQLRYLVLRATAKIDCTIFLFGCCCWPVFSEHSKFEVVKLS